jgi:hypothetical protein
VAGLDAKTVHVVPTDHLDLVAMLLDQLAAPGYVRADQPARDRSVERIKPVMGRGQVVRIGGPWKGEAASPQWPRVWPCSAIK